MHAQINNKLIFCTKMTPDLPSIEERKEYLALPTWLESEYKSKVADLEGWQCVEIARADYSGRKDKVSILLLFSSSKNGANHVLELYLPCF